MEKPLLGDRVEAAMQGAGIKARTLAAVIGCHYTTIYTLLRDRDSIVPLRLMQEKIYDTLDFLEASIKDGTLPLSGDLTVSQKNEEVTRLFDAYNAKKANRQDT